MHIIVRLKIDVRVSRSTVGFNACQTSQRTSG